MQHHIYINSTILGIHIRCRDIEYYQYSIPVYSSITVYIICDCIWQDQAIPGACALTPHTPNLRTHRIHPTTHNSPQVFARGQDAAHPGLTPGFLEGAQHQRLVRGRAPRHRVSLCKS